jgi:hypothetical protein
MTPVDYSIIAGSVISVLAGFTAAVRFLVKSYLSELKPNSGSSMRDEVKVNSARLERLEGRVDSIYEILCNKNN